METSPAIRVLLTRDAIESEHVVDAVIADPNGPVRAWGRVDAPIIPRSAIKAVQAVPLVRTGAAAAYDLSDIELALGAASHVGEPAHIEAVSAWLARIGYGPENLECGSDRPILVAEADRMLRAGEPFTPLHNCCSGKHTGFLTIARHFGFEPAGYIDRDHPVQHLITEAVEQFTGLDLSRATNGRDGCGIPTFSMPAANLAMAMARIVRPGHFDDDTAEAATTIARVMIEHPWWISGTGRAEVTLSGLATEPLLLKGGAEGVIVAAFPERGWGLAVKSRDGSRRGADTALAAVLEVLGVVAPGASRSEVTNKAGTVVGEMFAEIT